MAASGNKHLHGCQTLWDRANLALLAHRRDGTVRREGRPQTERGRSKSKIKIKTKKLLTACEAVHRRAATTGETWRKAIPIPSLD
jgi:hypothetical protein